MSYQVLARKWRPHTFREMVGQEHVLQALINALDHDRLHHAYLFTGTRGVGKTTIARILAKCLNCEVGVSSVPCNECSACTEINEGRFVDLIEVDAASRTKVEDTRELLENVQYAPTRGRYKVYLIDEVHMLSNSSFNALLKTLEEPPPHVKFLLATTDPQKLPVTILSRCLQFNLKNMTPERIVSHLQFVLEKEMVPFEDAGLWQLARSADGSMRDALSLTDQSIAFGDGKITDVDVRTMLGTIDQSLVYDVLQALINEDVSQLLKAVSHLSEHSPDYGAALAELITTLHRVAIAQALPEAVDNSQGDRQKIYDFAQNMSAEDVQLYYQTALLGRRDLPLVPDPRNGFEMVLLRMLAFKPQGVAQLPTKPLAAKPNPNSDIANDVSSDSAQAKPESAGNINSTAGSAESTMPVDEQANYSEDPIDETSQNDILSPSVVEQPEEASDAHMTHTQNGGSETVKKPDAASILAGTFDEEITPHQTGGQKDGSASPVVDAQALGEKASSVVASSEVDSHDIADAVLEPQKHETTVPTDEPHIPLHDLAPDKWFSVYSGIKTGGLLQSTVANCQLIGREGNHLTFLLDEQQSTLYDSNHQERLADLLTNYFGQTITVDISLGPVSGDTPALITIRRQQERLQQAKISIESDPVVQQLQEIFDATVVEESITPIN